MTIVEFKHLKLYDGVRTLHDCQNMNDNLMFNNSKLIISVSELIR